MDFLDKDWADWARTLNALLAVIPEKTGGDPVIISTGNFQLQETDLSIKGRGIDFTFTRAYRSGSAVDSLLGNRWTFNWDQKIVLEFEQGYVPPWNGPGDTVNVIRNIDSKGRGGGKGAVPGRLSTHGRTASRGAGRQRPEQRLADSLRPQQPRVR